jgi:hypothetical protein
VIMAAVHIDVSNTNGICLRVISGRGKDREGSSIECVISDIIIIYSYLR